MEDGDVKQKHRNFAADYQAGMDRAQLSAKYSIPDDKFESYLKFLSRTGILLPDPPQPVVPSDDAPCPPDTPAPLVTGQAAVGSNVHDVGGSIILRYPRALICYLVALSITIVLILNGTPSLTGRLWKTKIQKRVLTANQANLYVKFNTAEVYVDLTADGHSFKYKVIRSYPNLPLDESGHSILRIEDQTKIRLSDLNLRSAHDTGPVQDAIKESKCYIESLNRPVKNSTAVEQTAYDPFTYSKIERIQALPDCVYYGTANRVVLELYDYEVITWEGYLKKGVATLFTVNADIILIPLEFVGIILFFIFSPRIM